MSVNSVTLKRMGRPVGMNSRTNAEIYASRVERKAQKSVREHNAWLKRLNEVDREDLDRSPEMRLARDLKAMLDRWEKFCR